MDDGRNGLVEVDEEETGGIDIGAIAVVAPTAAFATVGVIVFGEIDSAIGIDGFNPHNVAVGAGIVDSDGVDGGLVVDAEATGAGEIVPGVGVAPE